MVHACMRDGPVFSIELDLNGCAAMSSAQRNICIILRVKDDDLQAMPQFVQLPDVYHRSLCGDDTVRSLIA